MVIDIKSRSRSFFEHFDRFSSNFELELIRKWSVNELQKNYTVMALNWCSKLHFAQYILKKIDGFDKDLYCSRFINYSFQRANKKGAFVLFLNLIL